VRRRLHLVHAPFWVSSVGGARPSFAESHSTTYADTTGIGRPDALLRWPDDYVEHPATRRPLIVLLPGRGNTGTVEETIHGWSTLKNDYPGGAFVLLYTGKTSTTGATVNSLNGSVNSCCWPDADSPTPDDVAWLDSLIASVESTWPVDTKKVFVFGHSAGNFLGYRYACDHADKVAAFVGMSGAGQTVGDAACSPSAHVPMAHMHGTSDATVIYDNSTAGKISPEATEYVSVEVDRTSPSRPSTMTQAKTFNGCSGSLSLTTAGWGDFDSVVGGSETDLYTMSGCPSDGDVQLWKANGGGHSPTVTAAWRTAIINFFVAHPKP
jgi:polyhydroxybutyrate depolymerase